MTDAKRVKGLTEVERYFTTPEGKANLLARMEECVQHQSGKDGHCTTNGCDGLIVKQVAGCCSW